MHDFEKRVVDRARSNKIEGNVISIAAIEKTNLIDPLEHPKIKKLITDFFGSGVRRIFQSRNDSELVMNRLLKKEFIPIGGDKSFNVPYGKEAMSCGRETGCWADALPRTIRVGYGLYAPATNIRMPRQISKHGARSHEIYRSYRGSRYMHILIAAWASNLPLTEDMFKNLLDPWFQDKFENAINKFRKANLISELDEDWSDTPIFYGKTTDAPHIRPTRQQIYVSLEAIIFLYDSLRDVFDNNDQTCLDLFDMKNWVHHSTPMPSK
jgi:hypothetical protein|tara:strand:+ start:47 stop:847 length:801 start_codon:yes stop_codon:yes gene_type:complete